MNNDIIKVLLIADDEDDYILTRDLLAEVKGGDYALDWAGSYAEGLKLVGRGEHHVCLMDFCLGEKRDVELILEARKLSPSTSIIVLTGQGSHDVDLEAMQAGANGYLVKAETSSARLEQTIRYAVELTTERRRAELKLGDHARKHSGVAEIGRRALMGGELEDLFVEAVALLGRTLGVEYCEV